jgi:hypothetical protein
MKRARNAEEEDDIKRTLSFYHSDGTTFEICGFGTDHYPKAVDGGFFNDHERASKAARGLTENHHAVYTTINPVDKALLGRANNRIRPGISRTQDKDVTRIKRLLVDCDPIRPSKISSTDGERLAAIELCEKIKAELSAAGWPEPLIGDSGNGGHLVYVVDLENVPENVDIIKRCLQSLTQKYDNEAVQIDQSVFNPARISKVYGTWARKGDDTPDRPHRLSRIISVPDEPKPVKIELLKALAATARSQSPKGEKPTGTTRGKLDLAAYLDKYEIPVKEVKEHQGATLHVLETCIFDETHTDGEASIVQGADGRLFYQCFHNSCKDKKWKDARQKISGDAKLKDFTNESENATQAQLLIQLAADATLFHGPDDGRFAEISQDEHREVWPIRSKGFRNWLIHRFYLAQGKPPGAQALTDALGVLEAKAGYDGEAHPVFVRVGEQGGNIYLDLCNDSWEVVEITRKGWRVVSDPSVKFRRTKSMLALPYPERGGSLEELRPFLNLPDNAALILVYGFLVQSLRPTGPYPILNLEGEHGTAKSNNARILRSLVDPSTAILKTVPRDERDLMIGANNSWLLAFDNLSGIPPWLSDALCRLATGGGFSTRKLYTNDEETIFDAMRPIILTGIDRIAYRHDLIDRSIIIVLPHIPDCNRRTEIDLRQEFETVRPRILGALCDAISAALANISTTKLDRKPRMADLAMWVTAAEPALPCKPGDFMEAYAGNRKEAVELALEADLVSSAIMQFMSSRIEWTGTAKALLDALEKIVEEKYRRDKDWPKKPNSLSRKLRRNASFLRANGLEIILATSGSWRRDITIRRIPKNIVETGETVETGSEQESTANDVRNGQINGNVDSENTVEKPLTDKSAQDKAFNDNVDVNDKKPTFSIDEFWAEDDRTLQLEAEIHARMKREADRRSRLHAKRR